MKLSIIIPCYNCSHTIERCLDSIGDYSGIGVILVNDKSEDSTADVIKNYIKKTSFTKYAIVTNEINLGAGETRNVGLHLVDSEYFMFADADDWFEEGFVVKILKQVEIRKPDCIIFDAYRSVSGRKTYFSMFFSSNISEGYIKRENAFVFTKGCPWGKVYKSSILEDRTMKFASIKINEDLVFTKKALLSCDSIYYLNEPLYVYEDTPMSLMHRTQKDAANYTKAFDEIKSSALSVGMSKELNALYQLEVIYPIIMDLCAQNARISEIVNVSNKLCTKYNEHSVYVSQYSLKYRIMLKLMRAKLFIIIKWMLKLC